MLLNIYNVLDSPPPQIKNYPSVNASGAEFESPVLEVYIHIFRVSGLTGKTNKMLTMFSFKLQVQVAGEIKRRCQ